MLIFLAVKVSFRVAREEIKHAVILCCQSEAIRHEKWSLRVKESFNHARIGVLQILVTFLVERRRPFIWESPRA